MWKVRTLGLSHILFSPPGRNEGLSVACSPSICANSFFKELIISLLTKAISASAVVTSALTPGLVLVEVVYLIMSQKDLLVCESLRSLFWKPPHILGPSLPGFLVAILRVLVCTQTGPSSLRCFSFVCLVRSVLRLLKMIVIRWTATSGLAGSSCILKSEVSVVWKERRLALPLTRMEETLGPDNTHTVKKRGQS